MDKRLGKFFMLLSVFALSIFASCKDIDNGDDKDDETPKKEEGKMDVNPAAQKEAEKLVKILCSGVWDESGETYKSYCAYELAGEDEESYYLNCYQKYVYEDYGEYREDYYSYLYEYRILKNESLKMYVARGYTAEEWKEKFSIYATSDFKIKNGWIVINDHATCHWLANDLYSTVRQHRDISILDADKIEYEVQIDDATRIFNRIQSVMKELGDMEISCPQQPKLLSTFLQTGQALYIGEKDDDYYYMVSVGGSKHEIAYYHYCVYSIKDDALYKMHSKKEIEEGSEYEEYKAMVEDIKANSDIVKVRDKDHDGEYVEREYYIYKKSNKVEIISDSEGEYLREYTGKSYLKRTDVISREEIISHCKD